MTTTTPIRVALVDDHAILRDGLRLLFAADARFVVVGEADTLARARARLAGWRADVVVLDLQLGDGDGIELMVGAGADAPHFVVLSMVDAPATVERALRAGARGFVLKGRGGDRLLGAVAAAMRGETWLDEAIAGQVVRGFLDDKGTAPEQALSKRELEIVALIAAGWTSAEVARALGLATKTVQNHRSVVLDKLGLRTTASLVRWALERGVASSRPPPA